MSQIFQELLLYFSFGHSYSFARPSLTSLYLLHSWYKLNYLFICDLRMLTEGEAVRGQKYQTQNNSLSEDWQLTCSDGMAQFVTHIQPTLADMHQHHQHHHDRGSHHPPTPPTPPSSATKPRPPHHIELHKHGGEVRACMPFSIKDVHCS